MFEFVIACSNTNQNLEQSGQEHKFSELSHRLSKNLASLAGQDPGHATFHKMHNAHYKRIFEQETENNRKKGGIAPSLS